MALPCIRVIMFEHIHTGRVLDTRNGGWYVTVFDPGGRHILWPDVPRFDDGATGNIVRSVVECLYTFQVRAEESGFLDQIVLWVPSASRWDNPQVG